MEPGTLASRAKTFAASIPSRGSAALVAARNGSGLVSVVVLPDDDGSDVAIQHLAAATAAQASPFRLDELDLAAESVGRAVFAGGSAALRDTQVGADPAALAQVLGRALPMGAWVSVLVRPASTREQGRWLRWLKHRLSVTTPHHHSNEANALVMSVIAGSQSRRDTVSLLNQVVAAMPGFDLPVVVRAASRWRPLVWSAPAAVLAGAGAAFQWGPVVGAIAVLVVGAVGGTGVMLSRVGKSHDEVVALLARGPRTRRIPPRRPRVKTREDGSREDFAGDYPLAADTFLVGAHLPVGLVAPHAGGSSGAVETLDRAVPAAATSRVGPLIGRGAGDVPVFLSAADQFAGTFAVGKAGSGKSVCLRQLFAWHLLEREAPSGIAGSPGARCALVAIESKQDGARKFLEWGEYLSPGTVTLVDVMDPESWAIDLTPPGTDIALRARRLVSQMQYAFGEDAIAFRSFATLVQLAMGAFVVDEEIAADANLAPNLGVMHYMAVMVEAFGETAQLDLAGAIMSAAVRRAAAGSASSDLLQAAEYLKGLFQGKTPAQRRQFTEAPSSKMQPLLALGSWWEPTRPRLSWRDILTHHGVVVINVGASLRTGTKLDAALAKYLQSMLMFSLKEQIEETCADWSTEGRSVAVFSDELSLLSGTSPEVITWLRDQGRSYGVRPFFATQYPDQLTQVVRTSVLGFSTVLSLSQDNPDVAGALAKDFAADGTPWSVADVVSLPRHTAIARVNVAQQRQPAFTVSLTSWEGDPLGFADAQGFPASAVRGVVH